MKTSDITKIITMISGMSEEELQTYLDKTPVSTLHSIKLYADNLYYNEGKSSGLTDWEYDMFKGTLARRDPNSAGAIGAKVREGDNRAELPFWLGSMDKFKPEDGTKIATWLQQNRASEYIIEDKLDGVSCLIRIDKGRLELFTRGDGIIGADISALAPFFNTVPKGLEKPLNVRGELIMPIKTFEEKYSKDYANPRNLVAGLINAKKVRRGIKDVRFIAYEIVGEGVLQKPSTQLASLDRLGFTTVRRELVAALTIPELQATLIRFKESSPYEIDGLIVQPDAPYVRNEAGNPPYAFAFKMRMEDNLVTAKVVAVNWRISKWGQLKPRVEIEPTRLGGVTVTFATGFNAKFIEDNVVGPGAMVELTRSGDVIPYIVKVVKPAKEPEMPEIPYKWNASKVDIEAEDIGPLMCIRLISSFLHQMGMKNVAEKTVAKLYAAGVNTVLKLMAVTVPELLALKDESGKHIFQKKSAENIFKGIHTKLDEGLPLARMLGASGVFGFGVGKKRVAALIEAIPNLFTEYKTMSTKELKSEVLRVEGFADKTADEIVKNVAWAALFADAMSHFTTYKKPRVSTGEGPLTGYTVVISGTLGQWTRKQAQEAVEEAGGVLGNKVKKPNPKLKQIVVIVGPPTTSKAKDAQKYGLKTYSEQEFLKILKEGM